MFDQIQQQNLADQLKRLIGSDRNGDEYDRAIAALQNFERAGWQPRLFADLASRRAPGLEMGGDGKLRYVREGRGDTAREAVTKLLEAYLVAIEPRVTPGMLPTQDAATYLGVKTAILKRYAYEKPEPRIPSVKVGRDLFFSQVELDKFDNEKRRSAGRPKIADKVDL
jgi:hypothetical protein